jgi:phospholipid/cholesterol/gamma-HCH transport system substrate-binding protein
METRVNHAVVGVFVLVLGTAAVAAVLWLGSGRLTQKAYGTYLAYFSESVSGLNLHAAVKYRGVAVGSVREIALDTANPERVRLVLEIEQGTPVKVDSVAVLSVQGLTGIAFVELGGGSREAPALTARDGEPWPVIATGPSLMRRLDTAGTTLLANLDETTRRVSDVLDAENRATLRRTLVHLERVTAALAARSADLEATVAESAVAARHAAQASAALPKLVERFDRSAIAVERMADAVARAGASADAVLAEARGALEGAGGSARQLEREALPEVTRLVAELGATTSALGRVARELEQDPGVLLRGRAPRRPGPGE